MICAFRVLGRVVANFGGAAPRHGVRHGKCRFTGRLPMLVVPARSILCVKRLHGELSGSAANVGGAGSLDLVRQKRLHVNLGYYGYFSENHDRIWCRVGRQLWWGLPASTSASETFVRGFWLSRAHRRPVHREMYAGLQTT